MTISLQLPLGNLGCKVKAVSVCVFAVLLCASSIMAQEKCATFQMQQTLKEKFPEIDHDARFENWLSNKVFERKIRLEANGNERTEAEVVQIPVVVHIIHNGEAVGTGSNISDEQIFSQIDVLNEDFRRTNADASETLDEFVDVAADSEIEFVLAQQDPEGIATTGIVRVQGAQTEWTDSDNISLKATSYWSSEDYLNIWVANLGGGLLGYAQFPVSDELDGLESASDNPLTDGVVIHYDVFGSDDKGDFDINNRYNKGRTTTHEVGHFFGLRHIWGDDFGNCESGNNGTDYCDDTPDQGNSTGECPSGTLSSCGSNDMYQNYMDYTVDECMNIFTEDQKSRMRTVLDNSPRRVSLKTSIGGEPPSPVPNDMGVKEIISPVSSICAGELAPKIVVRNYGSNDATSVQVQLSVNGIVQETLDFAVSLEPLEMQEVSFNPLSFSDPIEYTFTFEVLSTNGTTDGNSNNNEESVVVSYIDTQSLPFVDDFETQLIDWETRNPDSGPTWEYVIAPNSDARNTAIYMDFYEYAVEGEIDYFITPSLDFSDVTKAIISMDIAYTTYPGFEDGLRIAVSTDCGNTFEESDIVFEEFGEELSSVASSTSAFVPSGDSDWKKECIDLNDYIGYENIRIAFIAINGFGNNLYLDNIRLVTDDILDISITEVLSPSPVSCESQPAITVELENIGNEDITSFDFSYVIDNRDEATITFDEEILPSCGSIVIELPQEEVLSTDKHLLNMEVSNPNGQGEDDTSDNSLTYLFEIKGSEKDRSTAPYLENFDGLTDFDGSEWAIYNPDATTTWEIYESAESSSEGSTVSAYLNSYNYEQIGEQEWLISPTYSFEGAETVKLVFDLSYAYNANRETPESLKVLLSRDCGSTFTETVYDLSGSEFNVADTIRNEWFPTLREHWTKVEVPLADYIDEEDIRLAFVVTNNNGNNIFIDNIELFTNETAIRLSDFGDGEYEDGKFWLYPNPSVNGKFYVAFDLEEHQDVRMILLDATGKVISDETVQDILNQNSIEIDVPKGNPGLYMLNVVGEDFNVTRKVILVRQ